MVDAATYHDRTKHSPQSVRETDATLDPATKPRPFKRYRDLPREPLSGVRPPQVPALAAIAHGLADPLAGTGQPPPRTPDRETLATLCYESAGVTGRVDRGGRERRFRAASCTGNLHHVELYVVCGSLPDLGAGVYHFDPETFSLGVLREGDYRDALAAATGEADGRSAAGVSEAPLTVVATSVPWRNAWKYRDRTYRHAFWDSGTVLANLLATAHALDYRAGVVAGFDDDRVAELIGVDTARELPLELVPVGTGDPAPDAPTVGPIDPAIEPQPARDREYPLVRDAWRASALDAGEVAAWRERCRTAGRVGAVAPGEGERVPLDPVDWGTASARPLHATVRRRGSKREYASGGPSRRKVGTVLDRALRGVPGDWNAGGTAPAGDGRRADGNEGGAGLAYNDAFVLSTGVEGIPDGSYQYHPAGAALERLRDVTAGEKTRLALGQDWAGEAHVNVYMMADVDRVVGELGDRGYRLAQLEAGVALGRLYLAAYAHRDLGGTGLTFFDDLVTDHLSPRAADLTPTCLFAFGRLPD